jgi:hypothetical protein
MTWVPAAASESASSSNNSSAPFGTRRWSRRRSGLLTFHTYSLVPFENLNSNHFDGNGGFPRVIADFLAFRSEEKCEAQTGKQGRRRGWESVGGGWMGHKKTASPGGRRFLVKILWQRPTLTGPFAPLPLALQCFTSGFGMEPGGSTALWSPDRDSPLKKELAWSGGRGTGWFPGNCIIGY